jgi:uncharacterized membrane protein (DUF485 family)
MQANDSTLESLARRRWLMAMAICAAMIIVYFGFILLIAFRKEAMGRLIYPGLSVGIVIGALVILVTWAFTWVYVVWANRHVDAIVLRLNGGRQ